MTENEDLQSAVAESFNQDIPFECCGNCGTNRQCDSLGLCLVSTTEPTPVDTHVVETFGPVEGQLAVILNAPPGAGKDTLADLFCARNEKYTKSMVKETLYRDTAEYFGIDCEKFTSVAQNRELKEQPYLDGNNFNMRLRRNMTPREMLIHVSEIVIKPKHGSSYFGKQAGELAHSRGPYAIFSDGGFSEEIEAIGQYFSTVLIVQLHRDNFNFSGDSRNYIVGDNTAVVKLHEGEIEQGVCDIERAVDEFLRTNG